MKELGIKDPGLAYEQFASTLGAFEKGGVLGGMQKLGKSDQVIKNITKSGEHFDEFKKMAQKLNAPELVTTVKENWLSELFSKPNWHSQWEKAKKDWHKIIQMW